MPETQNDIDVEVETYLHQIELCEVQYEVGAGLLKPCARIATYELLIRCRNDHQYSILSCTHHKEIACSNVLACRVCRSEKDPEWYKWSVYVVAVWERNAK